MLFCFCGSWLVVQRLCPGAVYPKQFLVVARFEAGICGFGFVFSCCERIFHFLRIDLQAFLLGMDVYGYLLAREGRLEDVENLGCRLFNISDQHAEPWVVSG